MNSPSLTLRITLGSVIIVLAALGAGLYFYWTSNYQDSIYPGIMIGNLDLGGMTKEQADNILSARTEKISDNGLTFVVGSRVVSMPVTVLSPDASLSFPPLFFENKKMIDDAFGRPTDRTFFTYLRTWLIPREGKHRKAVYTLDIPQLRLWLEENFSDLIIEPANAYFSLEKGAGSEIQLNSHPETTGQTIDYDGILAEVSSNLDSLADRPVTVAILPLRPEITLSDLRGREEDIKLAAKRGALNLKLSADANQASGGQGWSIPADQLVNWMKTTKDSQTTLVLDEMKISAYLEEAVAPVVDREAILPRFEIKDGRVTSWQAGRPGNRLDIPLSASRIAAAFLEEKKEVELATEEITADNLSSDDTFEIKEIIGTGHSRFSGSPANRRHNIRIGADALHGLLIKPGEEFSLLAALGEIDAAAGYLPELVIKGNKTVPEYGGGLCQIGTTAFRSALASGLPITQRRNHSYRVSYYEPAGTDATIYDPAPDFRFLNDTGSYILIQSRIEGDDLHFDFWGVRDGRVTTMTDPVIYNIVKPAPTKMIETDELAPGEKKCTESAHNGADAYFDYTVVYPEGSTTTPEQTRRFSSHYIPWQAVCLVGRAASSTPTAGEETATTTPPQAGATSTTLLQE